MNADILIIVRKQFAEIYPNSVKRNGKIRPYSVTNRIYARLDFTLIAPENEINIEADYFGSIIQIKIKHAVKSLKSILFGHIFIKKEYGLLEVDKILIHHNINNLINEAVKLINRYVKSRPFTIIQYSQGQHKLLDPNGRDYIGQYVTLMDAKKTSCYNYQQ